MIKVERVLDVACYIYNEFEREMHDEIDEMKLHLLLYFVQRESFVQTEQPLFEEGFQGRKYDPVCIPVRDSQVTLMVFFFFGKSSKYF